MFYQKMKFDFGIPVMHNTWTWGPQDSCKKVRWGLRVHPPCPGDPGLGACPWPRGMTARETLGAARGAGCGRSLSLLKGSDTDSARSSCQVEGDPQDQQGSKVLGPKKRTKKIIRKRRELAYPYFGVCLLYQVHECKSDVLF
jgi:hypothetical protein